MVSNGTSALIIYAVMNINKFLQAFFCAYVY